MNILQHFDLAGMRDAMRVGEIGNNPKIEQRKEQYDSILRRSNLSL